MRLILPMAAALVLGATPMLARDDSFSPPERGPGHASNIYERIASHYGPMGRDVREKFRDGPCKITREWEKDGDYKETIKCRGPRN
jgi:hypothetical protein